MPTNRNSSPLFMLVVSVVIIASLHFAKEILLPLALAILLSFLLTPMLNRVERLRIGRIPSVLIVVGLAFSVIGVLGWIVTSQLIDISRDLPSYRENVVQKIRAVKPRSQTLAKVTDTIEDLTKEITAGAESSSDQKQPASGDPATTILAPETKEQDKLATAIQSAEESVNAALTRPSPATSSEVAIATAASNDDNALNVRVISMPPSPLAQIQAWLGPFVAPLTTAGMVIVLVLFILIDRESQRDRLIQLFGKSNLHTTTEAFVEANGRVSRYLRMQFLLNASYGICVGIGLWLIGVPSAVTWGVLSFALRFLPYIGPLIAAAMPIVVSLAVSTGWTQPLLVLGLYIVLELLLNNVAEPLLYGGSVGVSSVGVIIAAIFWTWIWGPIGLIVAMPMTVCLMVFSRYVPQLRFLQVLLADRPAMTLPERIYQRLLAFDYRESLKLAHQHLKSNSLVSFYDEALIPALQLAEEDRHAGLLNEDQEAFVQEAAQDLIDELGSWAAAQIDDAPRDESAIPSADTLPSVRVLCIPLRDEADENASRMLAQLLKAEGFQVESGTADSLTSELVERVAKLESDVVVISIMPPIAPRDSRLLWKRLRSRYPDLPIIIGFWSGVGGIEKLVRPEDGIASQVATTLADAMSLVRSTAARRRVVARTG